VWGWSGIGVGWVGFAIDSATDLCYLITAWRMRLLAVGCVSGLASEAFTLRPPPRFCPYSPICSVPTLYLQTLAALLCLLDDRPDR